MKRLFTLLTLVLGFLMCHAQDIIVLKNRDKIKAEIIKIEEDSVIFRFYEWPGSDLQKVSKAEIKSIIQVNGTTMQFQNQIMPPVIETRVRRLKLWSNILLSDGILNVFLGGTLLIIAGDEKNRIQKQRIVQKGQNFSIEFYYEDKKGYKTHKNLGTIALVGSAFEFIGYATLRSEYKRILRENEQVTSVPLFQKEIQLENVSITPSVNLMSYRNNPAEGIGAGISVKF